MFLREDGIKQAEEASGIFERVGDAANQAACLIRLTWVLHDDGQLDSAKGVASRTIGLILEKGQPFLACDGHHVLGRVLASNGETDRGIHHLEVALGVASSLDLAHQLFWVHFTLVKVFCEEGGLNDARAHIERAKSYAVNYTYILARALHVQAHPWDKQHRSKEAKSKALRALDVFEKLGAANRAEETRRFLKQSDCRVQGSEQSSFDGELPEAVLLVTSINSFAFRHGHSIRMMALILVSSSPDMALSQDTSIVPSPRIPLSSWIPLLSPYLPLSPLVCIMSRVIPLCLSRCICFKYADLVDCR